MADWLVVMSEDNWLVSARESLIGLGRDAERRLNRMAEGDRVWIYVNRKHVDRQLPHIYEIRACVRITGPVRHLTKSPWRSRGDQSFTVGRPAAVEREMKVPALDLLKSMSFAGRPPAWALPLLNAPIRLAPADVERLEAAAA